MADFKELYYQDSIGKQIRITDGEITLTGSNIAEGEFSIEQVLCDESRLKIGRCVASTLKMRIIDTGIFLKGRELTVEHLLEGADKPFPLGTYHVESDKPTADRNYRDIVAYDDMEYIRNTEVSDWYNNLSFPMSLKTFRDNFFNWMGIEQENVSLVNDAMTVSRTIEARELYGETIVEAICEINGCFGHVSYDRVFQYVFLKNTAWGLYPANNLYPADDLYPEDNEAGRLDAFYKSGMDYEDYRVQRITKLQIRQDSDDIGKIAGDGENCYVIEGNFLVYGKSDEELGVIAENTFSVISQISEYTPINCPAKGNPALFLGDSISINTTKEMVSSYILSRTLTGVQALNDVYVSKGEEYYTQKTGKNKQVIQLQSKVNRISQTVDGFQQEIASMSTKLENDIPTKTEMSTAISASAQGIETKVSKSIAESSENIIEELNTTISQTAEGLNVEIAKKVGSDELITQINASAEGIQIDTSKLDLNGYVTITNLSTEGETNIDGANITTGTISADRINVNALFSKNITATNLTLSGDSIIQLGGRNTEVKQYVYLVGIQDGITYETGLFPSRFYTLSDDGYSMNIAPNAIAFGTSTGTSLQITSGADGVALYSAMLSHEFVAGSVVVHTQLYYIAGGAYHDIIQIIQKNIMLGNLVE